MKHSVITVLLDALCYNVLILSPFISCFWVLEHFCLWEFKQRDCTLPIMLNNLCTECIHVKMNAHWQTCTEKYSHVEKD